MTTMSEAPNSPDGPIKIGQTVNREEIAGILSMYDDRTLYINTHTQEDLLRGVSTYVVREQDVVGYRDGKFPEHILTEAAMQSLGLTYGVTNFKDGIVGVFGGVTAEFTEESAAPGAEIRIEGRIVSSDKKGFVGECRAFSGEVLLATFTEAKAGIMNIEAARKIYTMAKLRRERLLNAQESEENRKLQEEEIVAIGDLTYLGADEILGKLPDYEKQRLYLDGYCSTEYGDYSVYTVREHDVRGHFAGHYRDIQLFPGHLLMEGAKQAMALSEGDGEVVFRKLKYKKITSNFSGFVFPGNDIHFIPTLDRKNAGMISGICDASVGDELVGSFTDIEITQSHV